MAQLELMLLFLLHAGREDRLSAAATAVGFRRPVGTAENLECDNDFVFAIDCSLNVAPADGGPRWLAFEKKYTGETYECALSDADGGPRACSVTTDVSSSSPETFKDYDLFRISLCRKPQSDGAERSCRILVESYRPPEHIKPNAPCCLAVAHNSSRHRFTWNNTYEEISTLKDYLQYQLCFHKRGDGNGVRCRFVTVDSTEYSVADSDLETDTEYSTKVRSVPCAAPFRGKWSDWSQEVHWRTGSAHVDGLLSKNVKKVFLASAVTATLVLILCCASLKRWRRGAFVPTPAPYFQSLYSECHGDFKSWVDTQPNMTMTLKPEETLQVDSHKDQSPAQDHRAGLPCKNTSQPVRRASPARPGEEKAQRGPGGAPLRGEPPRSCHEYCTLSASQQPETSAGKVTSESSEYDYC